MTLSGGRSFVSAISEDGTWEWSVVGSGSYKSDSGSIKALQHLDFLGERLVVSGFTGERGASLDPYNIEVDNGIVHFTADVVLLDEDGDGVGSVDECPQGWNELVIQLVKRTPTRTDAGTPMRTSTTTTTVSRTIATSAPDTTIRTNGL